MLKFHFIIVAVLLVTRMAVAQSEPETPEWHVSGWTETIVSVDDVASHDEFFSDVLEWEMRDQGEVSREQLTAWGLPKKANARFRLYANKGTKGGYIRLVEFNGVEQRYIREDSQSWDSGGIFDANIRVRDIETVAKKMRRLGWKSRAPITRFIFGPYDVKEWIVASPDNLELALVDRISPKLEGWPHFKASSRLFNSTQIVRDFDKSVDFYKEVLGFELRLEEIGYLSKEPGPNSLGFPYNLQTVFPRNIVILGSVGEPDLGNVEIVKVLGLDGADHSEHANLPNLGLAVLRFPVRNIQALKAHFKQKKVDWVHKLKVVDGVNRMTIRAPEGAWLEFYEAL